jgi:hypothetical protein
LQLATRGIVKFTYVYFVLAVMPTQNLENPQKEISPLTVFPAFCVTTQQVAVVTKVHLYTWSSKQFLFLSLAKIYKTSGKKRTLFFKGRMINIDNTLIQ